MVCEHRELYSTKKKARVKSRARTTSRTTRFRFIAHGIVNRLHSLSGKFGQSDISAQSNISALRSHTISSINIDERSFGSSSVSGSYGGTSSPSTSSIYKLMKIQTKVLADSNRLVSARLSSLES
jgi:hypothetical protein